MYRCEEHNKQFESLKGLANHKRWERGEYSKFDWSANSNPERNRKLSEMRMGSKNPLWKGDKVGYSGVHWWIQSRLGKPNICQDCGTTTAKYYDWANVDKSYTRDFSKWIRLCRRCHMVFDSVNFGIKNKYE